MPPGRIQAVLIHQPLAWRPFGWAQVRMNVAGYAGSGQRQVHHAAAGGRPSRTPRPWSAGCSAVSTSRRSRSQPPPRRAALRAPLWWRRQLVGSDEHVFVVRHGLLSRTIDVVPHERTQSVRLTAGPLQRALGLASVHLDSTRGPVKTCAANRDRQTARAMLDLQVERARHARLTPWQPSAAGALRS